MLNTRSILELCSFKSVKNNEYPVVHYEFAVHHKKGGPRLSRDFANKRLFIIISHSGASMMMYLFLAPRRFTGITRNSITVALNPRYEWLSEGNAISLMMKCTYYRPRQPIINLFMVVSANKFIIDCLIDNQSYLVILIYLNKDNQSWEYLSNTSRLAHVPLVIPAIRR